MLSSIVPRTILCHTVVLVMWSSRCVAHWSHIPVVQMIEYCFRNDREGPKWSSYSLHFKDTGGKNNYCADDQISLTN